MLIIKIKPNRLDGSIETCRNANSPGALFFNSHGGRLMPGRSSHGVENSRPVAPASYDKTNSLAPSRQEDLH